MKDTVPITLPADKPTSAMRARELALQQSALNRAIWQLIADARELRDRILALDASLPDDVDPAADALRAAGVEVPESDSFDFGPGTFDLTLEKLRRIADGIAEEIGLAVGEMPPPPAKEAA